MSLNANGQAPSLKQSVISVLNQSSSLANDQMRIVGKLTNTGDQIAYYVSVVASFYDQAGNFLGSNYTDSTPKTISPGGTSDFNIITNMAPIMAGNSYTLTIAWQNSNGSSSYSTLGRQFVNSRTLRGSALTQQLSNSPSSDSIVTSEYVPLNNKYLGTIGSFGSTHGKFFHPTSIEYSKLNDRIYVADKDNNRIQIFDSDGRFISSWSVAFNATQLSHPENIATDSRSDFIYVSQGEEGKIQKFDSDGNFISSWGSVGSGNGQFSHPGAIAVDSQNNLVFIADTGNNRIQKFDSDGNFISSWGVHGKNSGQFDSPTGTALDPTRGIIYVSDTNNHRIQKFYTNGTFVSKWGTLGDREGQFNNPADITYDVDSQLLYVSDLNNKRILVFTENGLPFYQLDLAESTNGLDIVPRAVTIDSEGKLFVLDEDNNRIHVFNTVSQAGPVSEANRSYTINQSSPIPENSKQISPGFKVYENQDQNVRLQYPSDWRKKDEYSNSIVRFLAPEVEGVTKPAGVLISIFQRPSGSNLEEFIDFFHNRRYAEQSEFTIVNSTDFELGNMEARKIILYEQKENVIDPKSDLKVMRVYAFDDRTYKGYTLRYYSEPGLFNKYLSPVQKMIDSFEVTGN